MSDLAALEKMNEMLTTIADAHHAEKKQLDRAVVTTTTLVVLQIGAAWKLAMIADMVDAAFMPVVGFGLLATFASTTAALLLLACSFTGFSTSIMPAGKEVLENYEQLVEYFRANPSSRGTSPEMAAVVDITHNMNDALADISDSVLKTSDGRSVHISRARKLVIAGGSGLHIAGAGYLLSLVF